MDTPYLLDELVKHPAPPIDGEEITSDSKFKKMENNILDCNCY